MRDDQSSTTALGATIIRAVHQLIDEVPPILEDPVSVRLLREDVVRQIQERPEDHRTSQAKGLRSHVVLRSRYAEDELHQAVESGITQFVSLGAGYDTFPARQPEWARGLKIIEVDHPATQRVIIEHFKGAGISFPNNVEFVPLDLEVGDLRSALAKTSLELLKPALIACLGVLAYLRPETVRRVFQAVASLSNSTKMVVAFAPREKGTEARVGMSTAESAAARGEPWLTRFDQMDLRQELLNCGFSEVAFLSKDEAARRYYQGRRDLPAPRKVRLCMAAV
jgi:methyltransferase (TIGR00027 family)